MSPFQYEFKGESHSSYNHHVNTMNLVADYFSPILFWPLGKKKKKGQIYSLALAPVQNFKLRV